MRRLTSPFFLCAADSPTVRYSCVCTTSLTLRSLSSEKLRRTLRLFGLSHTTLENYWPLRDLMTKLFLPELSQLPLYVRIFPPCLSLRISLYNSEAASCHMPSPPPARSLFTLMGPGRRTRLDVRQSSLTLPSAAFPLTNPRHSLLSWTILLACLTSKPLFLKHSFTVSIHLFRGPPTKGLPAHSPT